MSNSKCVYYKEKEQKSIDGGITWVDTGNFRKGGLISTQASQCGSFVTEYRWTKADYVCDNANKYKGYKQQVSYDNGGSWADTGVVDIGALIESNSKDCGYDEQWFVLTGDNNFICDGASKYKKKEMKYTRDSGTTWNSFDPPKYEKGDLIEENSPDCVPPSMKVTYVDGSTKRFTGLVNIEKNTVSNKKNVKEVEIYDDVTGIGDKAFSGCTSLTSITIPNSIISIGEEAFFGCSNLTGITIPNSVTSIGKWAFEGSSLALVTIGNGITNIGNGAFYFCNKLTTMTIYATTPPTLGSYAIWDIIPYSISTIYVPADSLDAYKTADGWKDYSSTIFAIGTIPTPSMKVTYKDNSEKTYYNLKGITYDIIVQPKNATSAEIYDGVEAIGSNAFYNCTGLTSVTIANSVTYIGWSAFQNCSSLTGIIIPNNIETIDDYAFKGCSGLTTMTLEAVTPPRLGTDAIPTTISTIYVPASSVNAYKSADGWKDYADKIKAIP